MKLLSEKQALAKLSTLRSVFQQTIKRDYERKAKNCLTCETQGACCLDTHFVNVHITRLEAAAIRNTLAKLSEQHQAEIDRRVDETVKKYDLSRSGDTFLQMFACPLFEKGTGCLVHNEGKPFPCIQHACYENREDLPPDELLAKQECRVEKLNRLTYGRTARWLPLPVAIQSPRPD